MYTINTMAPQCVLFDCKCFAQNQEINKSEIYVTVTFVAVKSVKQTWIGGKTVAVCIE